VLDVVTLNYNFEQQSSFKFVQPTFTPVQKSICVFQRFPILIWFDRKKWDRRGEWAFCWSEFSGMECNGRPTLCWNAAQMSLTSQDIKYFEMILPEQ